jgi:serine/threonine protein kinase
MESQSFIGGRYQLEKYLGQGTFGQVMQAVNITNQLKVAIKIEPITDIIANNEAEVLKLLRGTEGFPRFFEKIEQDNFSYLVMQRLGSSLYKLLKSNGGKFSIPTVAVIGLQVCTRLEELHKLGFLHRDIKPQQILIGYKDKARIYLIDFGLSRRYKISSMHIPYKSECSKAGNATFASLHVHNGIQQSRRDDMESFSYLLLYLLNGTLPWQNLSTRGKNEKWNKIALIKAKCNFLRVFGKYPNEFVRIVSYCKGLSFDATPDYDYIRGLLSRLLTSTQTIPDWLSAENPSKSITEKRRGETESTRSESSSGSKTVAQRNSRKRTLIATSGPELSQRMQAISQKLERERESGFEVSVDSVSHKSERGNLAASISDSSNEALETPQINDSNSKLSPDQLVNKVSFSLERQTTARGPLPSLKRDILGRVRAVEDCKNQKSETTVPSNESEYIDTESNCIMF